MGGLADRSRRQFRAWIPTLGVALTRVVGVLANFVVLVVFARLLTVPEFGTLSALLALSAFLAVPAVRGSDQSAIRLVAIRRGDLPAVRDIIRRLVLRSVLGSCIFGGIASLAGVVVVIMMSRDLGVALILTGATVVMLALLRVGEGSLRGAGSVVLALIGTNAVLPVVTIGTALLWSTADDSIGIVEGAAARLAGSTLAAGTVFVLLVRQLAQSSKGKPADQSITASGQHFLRAARWLMVVGVANAALTQVDVIILAIIGDPTEAGLYSAAARTAIAMNIALMAVNFTLGPRVARLFFAEERNQLQSAVTQAARAATVSAGVMAIGLLAFAPDVLLLFGPEFTAAATALRILSLGYLMSAFCGPAGTVLNMTGAQQSSGIAMIVALGVDLVLLFTLIPPLGAVGAAIASATSMATWNVLMVISARRILKIDVTAIGWKVRHAG